MHYSTPEKITIEKHKCTEEKLLIFQPSIRINFFSSHNETMGICNIHPRKVTIE